MLIEPPMTAAEMTIGLPVVPAPRSRGSVSPWPVEPNPQQVETGREQAARLLAHVARLVQAGLSTDKVWLALTVGSAPRWPNDPFAGVEQHARWIATRVLASICRGHAQRAGRVDIMIVSTALPGDWVDNLVAECTPEQVVAALTAAAQQMQGHHHA
jgi:hypothetical protein